MSTSQTVESPWASDADVTEKTITDLDQKRTEASRVSDPDYELHRLVDTLVKKEGYPDRSMACDRSLRVALAHIVDTQQVSFTREDYDVAYSIPPASWVGERIFPEVELIPERGVDTDERAIDYTTKPVCYEMAKRAVEEEVTETVSDLVKMGAKRLLGKS